VRGEIAPQDGHKCNQAFWQWMGRKLNMDVCNTHWNRWKWNPDHDFMSKPINEKKVKGTKK